MKNLGKITTIKNPLTVIAIFAGTAELSGTAILPFLEANSQMIYIWFLMLFPLFLIIFFFLTLNFNHKVLYAPSDFQNEDNFLGLLNKASVQEVVSNLEQNLNEAVEKSSSIESDVYVEPRDESVDQYDGVSGSGITKEERSKQDEIIRDITRQRLKDVRLAEVMVMRKLEKEFKQPIERDMKLGNNNTSVVVDGIIKSGDNLIGIEVKYFRTNKSFNRSILSQLKNRLNALYDVLNDVQRKSLRLILIIVSDEKSKLSSITAKLLSDVNIPVEVRFYDFDELNSEFKLKG